jgi:hypothetical protein
VIAELGSFNSLHSLTSQLTSLADRFNIYLLGLPTDRFHSCFSAKIQNAFSVSPNQTTYSTLGNTHDTIILTMLRDLYKSLNTVICRLEIRSNAMLLIMWQALITVACDDVSKLLPHAPTVA